MSQVHPSMRPGVAERRDREYAEARNAHEVAELEKRWRAEDRAILEAEGVQGQQLAELQRENTALEKRLARLERGLNPDKGWLFKSLGMVLRPMIDRIKELEQRPALHYAGVWDEGTRYAKGAAVTAGGSLWIALEDCTQGQRPGKAPGWRLAVKNGEARG